MNIANEIKQMRFNNAGEFDVDDISIVMDIDSMGRLYGSYANSIDLDYSKRMFIGIEIILATPPPKDGYISEQPDSEAIIVYPFCLYLRCKKKNGRYVYFDHPDCDEVFL